MVKKLLKKPYYSLAAIIGRHNFSFRNNNLLILTYHRVLPDTDERAEFEQPGMMVTPQTLLRNIKYLKNRFEIMMLGDWIELLRNNIKMPKYTCAITFDDGWRDNYEYAYPVLKDLNVPATVFLVSDYINSNHDFWPGRLTRLVRNITMNKKNNIWKEQIFNNFRLLDLSFNLEEGINTREQINELINKFKQNPDKENFDYIDEIYKDLDLKPDENRVLLNDNEIREMVKSGLIEIGSHTRSHMRMHDSLTREDIDNEIRISKIHLQEKFNTRVRMFCYPNGDTTEKAIAAVRKNYIGACGTKPGWNTPDSDAHLLKRINMHEDMAGSMLNFKAKISGWL